MSDPCAANPHSFPRAFAQFEREIISERTRDKIAAARRKGKWSGGMPLLGYDVDPKGAKLVVNEAEAVRVRAIFELYLQHEALLPVVEELERRGWRTKRWTTRKGRTRGGVPFTWTNLYHLLTRVAYVGKIQYKTEVHPGEHTGIVEPDVWERVQAMLRHHGRRDPARVRSAALLGGLLRCVPCGCRMSPSHSKGRQGTCYRYYVCSAAQKRGWQTCPSKSIPARTIEGFVLDQIRALAQDKSKLEAMVAELEEPTEDEAQDSDDDAEGLPPMQMVTEPGWDALSTEDQAGIVRRLVEEVTYDGRAGKVAITFQAAGLRALLEEGAES